MTIANMKTTTAIFLLALMLQQSLSAPPIAWSALDLAAISRMTPQELEILAEGLAAEEIIRSKRSNSAALVGQIASKVSSGLTSKLGLLGQASAGATSFISGASAGSKGDDHGHGYSYEPDHTSQTTKPVDFWTLKKSILNTLFQAVKAITGGVTILKGQLIKGGGAIASAAGKLISGKGDTVTNLGRKIVNSAQLSPPKHAPAHYGAPLHSDYMPPSAYGAPSAPGNHYGVPPSASSHYGPPPSAASHFAHSAPSAPAKYTSNYEGGKQLTGLHAGLILLKPLDSDEHHVDSHTAPSGPAHEHANLEYAPEPNKLSIFNSAFQALKGVIGSASPLSAYHAPQPVDNSHSHAPPASYGLTGPEHNSIHVPPPPPHSNSYDSIPSFKPMESLPAEVSHDHLDSYGAPAEDYGGVSFTHSLPAVLPTAYPPIVNPHSLYNINKISDNLDKLANLDRSSENIPLFNPQDLYLQMLLKNSKTSTSKPPTTTAVVFSSNKEDMLNQNLQNIIEPRSKSNELSRPNSIKRQGDKTKRSSGQRSQADSRVNVTKSIRYVLRGNRIVAV